MILEALGLTWHTAENPQLGPALGTESATLPFELCFPGYDFSLHTSHSDWWDPGHRWVVMQERQESVCDLEEHKRKYYSVKPGWDGAELKLLLTPLDKPWGGIESIQCL